MKRFNLFSISILFSLFSYAQDTVNSKFGKGLINVVAKDNSFKMKFGVRVQSLFVGSWQVNESEGIVGDAATQFLIRRARLKFDGYAYSPKLVFKLEIGLSNHDISGVSVYTRNTPRLILDAVVKWNFYQNFTLWAGQTKLAGNRERVISSANLQLVDRSLLNGMFNIDRDIGIQLRHHFTIGRQFIVREVVSISQGEGRNVTSLNLGGNQYTGRIEILPFGKFVGKGDFIGGDLIREQKPKLAFGVTYDYNNKAVRTRSNQGLYMANDEGLFSTDISTTFVDAMFKFKGFSFMIEYAARAAEKDSVENEDGSKTGMTVLVGKGLNAQMGYLFKNNWEIAGRFTSIALDKTVIGQDVQNQYTIGVSKYISGHKLKVQTDMSYSTIKNIPKGVLMYRLQFEVHF
jgi:phosphate-selective porin OprO and OprP